MAPFREIQLEKKMCKEGKGGTREGEREVENEKEKERQFKVGEKAKKSNLEG